MPRARLLLAAALLLAVIADDAPGDLDAPTLALELAESDRKTHLQHLYRKLGAHSRREAVQRARALGLLAVNAGHSTTGQTRRT